MINKIKIKPCASLPGQGVKMSNVSQNVELWTVSPNPLFAWPSYPQNLFVYLSALMCV